eukprot:1410-Heterococcus_DN1.PRE.3
MHLMTVVSHTPLQNPVAAARCATGQCSSATAQHHDKDTSAAAICNAEAGNVTSQNLLHFHAVTSNSTPARAAAQQEDGLYDANERPLVSHHLATCLLLLNLSPSASLQLPAAGKRIN